MIGARPEPLGALPAATRPGEGVARQATAPVFPQEPSGDRAVDSLVTFWSWDDPATAETVISYSFAGPDSVWAAGYGAETDDWQPLTEAQQAAARRALASWAQLAPIRFVEVADDASGSGVIRFARTAATETAQAYFPGTGEWSGDVWLGYASFFDGADVRPGSYGFATILHEIGHALGLKHPHGTSGTGVVLPAREDWVGASIMSYRSAPAEPLGAGFTVEHYPSTPMPLDVAAIRHLYGGPGNAGGGDDVYRWRPGERLFMTLVDNSGSDTLDWSARADPARIDLRPGAWSRLGEPFRAGLVGGGTYTDPDTLAIAPGTVIERAIGGSGADSITGNAAANTLLGGRGGDVLRGLGGDDRLDGGEGDDRLVGAGGADRLLGRAGRDRLDGGGGDDDLRGGPGDDVLSGAAGDDRLAGGDGRDQLEGGGGVDGLRGGAGDDRLTGGDGDDLLDGGAGRDIALFAGPRAAYLVEAAGEGSGRVTGTGAFARSGVDTLSGIEVLRFADLAEPFLAAGV